MELPVGQVSRKDFWINHIKAAENFDGTMKEYCKLHGLKAGSLSAYRKKLGFSKPRSEKAKDSGFSRVEVVQATSPKTPMDLPDPKWLAEFLKAWSLR